MARRKKEAIQMSMAQDGFTAEQIRMTQKQELVGRSEAVRLLKQGKGWKKPEPCKHIYGYCDDNEFLRGLADNPFDPLMETPFKYCPLCGVKI
jgi:hypothetical protein